MTAASKKRERVMVATLIAASLGAGLLLAEATLRLFPVLQPFSEIKRVVCSAVSASRAPSAKFGFTEPPNAVFFERQHAAEAWNFHATNADGFRDLFDTGEPRIAAFGDSFTRGSLVNNGETYADLVDAWTPSVGVRAYGLGGWGTGDALRALNAVAEPGKFDLVILAYYVGNDLTDNVKAGYSLSPDGAVVASDVDVLELQRAKAAKFSTKVKAFFFQHFQTVRLASVGSKALFGKNQYFDKGEGEFENLMSLGRTLLDEFQAAAARNGAKTLIVALPDYNEFRSDKARNAAARQYEMIRELSEDHDGVDMIDLRDAFIAADPEKLYGVKDKHLNRYGQYVMAREIAAKLGVSAPDYVVEQALRIRPDCAKADDYAKELKIYGPDS